MSQDLIEYINNLPGLGTKFLSNSLADYVVAIIIFTITCLGVYLAKKLIVGWLENSAVYSPNKFDDLFLNLLLVINFPFYFTFSLYIASRYLYLNEFINSGLTKLVILVGYFYLIRGLQKATESIIEVLAETGQEDGSKKLDRTTADFLNRFIGGIIWIVIVLLALQNFGYDVTTIVGGLGIAGIAIAFSLQNVLSDIFAYFTINLDKPFKKGDFIIVGKDMGTVKNIGLKNTRITTLKGEDLIITNKELTDSRINNYAGMERRRVETTISVVYETPKNKLEKIPQIIENIVATQIDATFDRAHLKELGAYSINFEIVYHIESSDYTTYMDIQQNILLEIIRRFDKEKIHFAYPTSVINVNKLTETPQAKPKVS